MDTNITRQVSPGPFYGFSRLRSLNSLQNTTEGLGTLGALDPWKIASSPPAPLALCMGFGLHVWHIFPCYRNNETNLFFFINYFCLHAQVYDNYYLHAQVYDNYNSNYFTFDEFICWIPEIA